MTQSYWRLKPSKVPLWKQKNDDNKIGKETKEVKKFHIKDTELDKYYEKLSEGKGEIKEVNPLPKEPQKSKIVYRRKEPLVLQPSL